MLKESNFQNIKEYNNGNEILSQFSPEQREEIEQKRKVLSSLAFFIGKDFEIPVELNVPGKGWSWDFKNNIIRIDPVDLLEKPMDYLRFVISHEGGHRRISRTEFIPKDVWEQPGFSFMMNSVEDPRDNNFVAESYPKFREQLSLGYEWLEELEKKSNDKAKRELGYIPRFKQAGYEYIRRWYREETGEITATREYLPDDVKAVVEKTLDSARDSWLVFPTKKMAEGREADEDGLTGEESIINHAKYSYDINLDKIWPEFKKLVEKDLEDQKMQEFMKDMQNEKGESGGGAEMPQDLKDKLSPEEQKELEDQIEKAIEEAKKQNTEKQEEQAEQDNGQGENADSSSADASADKKEEGGQNGVPIDMDSLSDELKQKIKDYLDSLPDEKKQELEKRADKSIKDFEKELNKDFGGKLTEKPEDRGEEGENSEEQGEGDDEAKNEEKKEQEARKKKLEDDAKRSMEKIEKAVEGKLDEYQKKIRELKPQISKLKTKLWTIFQSRRKRGIKSGYYDGEEFDVERRLQEKAKGVPIFDSQAWRRTELPKEKDYAISLLIDLSGSMGGNKIEETFNACVLFAEVLNALRIKYEIVGFNDRLYEYKNFGQKLSGSVRKKIITMKKEVENTTGGRARYNDDGWALSQTEERLSQQTEKEKLLLVISDGRPEPSPKHSGEEYELSSIVAKILQEKKVKIAGLGLGYGGIEAVKNYYPENHLLARNSEEMIEKISDLLLDLINNIR